MSETAQPEGATTKRSLAEGAAPEPPSSDQTRLLARIRELEDVTHDLGNLLESTGIAAVFLTPALSIRGLTPAANTLLHLGDDDIGRTLIDCESELLEDRLGDRVKWVIKHQSEHQQEIEDTLGRWYIRRILPYRGAGDQPDGAVVTFTDITRVKSASERLRVRERQQGLIAELGVGIHDLDELFQAAVEGVAEALDVEFVQILEFDSDDNELLLVAGHGWNPACRVGETRVHADPTSQAGFTLTSEEPVIVEDLKADERFWAHNMLLAHGVTSGISVLIGTPARPYGVLSAHTARRQRFNRFDASFLTSVANVLWEGISRHRSNAILNEARHAAEAASRAKSQFLANLSHEVRSPLTAILGYADLLLDGREDEVEIKRLHQIKQNGKYLLEIVDDILDLSRIEEDKLEIRHRRFSPGELLLDLGSMLRMRAHEKGLALNFSCVGAIPETIESDPIRVRQILVNIIGNAIKYTDAGEVDVVLRLPNRGADGVLRIDVADTGIGIEAEKLARLFEPFEQGSRSPERQQAGLGLGLAICNRLLDMLGGRIEVESEPGVGSTFSVFLPTGELDGVAQVELDGQFASVIEPEREFCDALAGCRVLVVDDIDYVVDILRANLERAGARVEMASNGAECLSAVKGAQADSRPYDAIVLDMMMPVMDGFETVGNLRDGGCRSAIIALTAAAKADDRERCLAAGCDDHLSKPVDMGRLIDTIAQSMQPTRSAGEQARLVNNRSIVVVDDHEDTVDVLKSLLESRGHDIRVAHDGATALKLLAGEPPQALIMDLTLPDFSGVELMEQIRADHEHLLCIAISGHSSAGIKDEALRAGFDHFLVKPVGINDLTALLQAE